MAKRTQVIRWVMTLATVLVLAALAWQCIDIYLVGNSPANLDASGVYRSPVYSVEIVAAHLRPLRPLMVIYVLFTVAALLAQSVAGEDKSRAPISPENRLRLMKTRVAALPDEAKDLERQRRAICFAAAGAVLVCAVPCLVYLLDRRHFVSWDLEQVMGQMLLHVAPWVVAAFGVVLAAAYAWGRNVNREIAALKGHVGRETSEQPTPRRLPVGLLRAGLYGVAILFIVLGVMNGGLRDVLVKAINICTECIGLG